MFDLIGGQLPWWVAGPGVGLCVVALYGLINARLGVSGAWLATLAPAEGWRPEPWRRTFLLALVGGSVLGAVLGPPVALHGYGALSEVLRRSRWCRCCCSSASRSGTAPGGPAAAPPGTGCRAARPVLPTAW